MRLELDLDVAEGIHNVPSQADFEGWVTKALQAAGYPSAEAELSIMVVSEQVSQTLNSQYRDKDKPTNVLSFPADIPDFVESPLLGDLVVCAPIVEQEAQQQNKTSYHHWAHMTIHGCLHLLGFDHIEDADAEEMESLEIKVLHELGIDNPYLLKEI